MRAFLLTLLLLVSSVASAQIFEQRATNDNGMPFLRIHNDTPYYVSCYYRDAYNYYTFAVAPGTVTVWIPVYGQYEWACQ